MAITNNGCILRGKALEDAAATGFTNPAVTTFDDQQWTRPQIFNILKSSVENATPSTTYENIRAACATQQAIDDNVFDATGTVEVYGDVTSIELVSDPDFGDTAPVYRCSMNVYAKIE